MTDSKRSAMNVFATPIEMGRYEVQLQVPTTTVSCTSNDLAFANLILDFVSETRANPKFRDQPNENGTFRCMNEKLLDLSRHFENVNLTLEKLGEYDDGYQFRFECPSSLSTVLELNGAQLDLMLDGLRDIIDENSNAN